MNTTATQTPQTRQIVTVNWQHFGGFLRRMRQRQGISQDRLAETLSCDRTYVWRLEDGRNRPSRIFLHNLRQSCALTSQEAALLAIFVKMREHHCDTLELEEYEAQLLGHLADMLKAAQAPRGNR